MRLLLPFALLAPLAALSILRAAEGPRDEPAAKGNRLFEMRTYTTHPSRLDALNKRFREHTNKLFVKHGMELVGYWTPQGKDNTLVYILAYPSKEAREASWKAFQADPAWKEAREASEKDGKIVAKVDSVFLDPTDYSPIK